ncbi:MAG: hypothetical protein QOE79_2378 [Sphingomonadales bacterium]|nr:hypothetical protein [Sphingomonadales bacterium]
MSFRWGPSGVAALWPGGAVKVKARGRGKMAKRDEERERRLAEALRANLHRRKAQARGEVEREGSVSPALPSPPGEKGRG